MGRHHDTLRARYNRATQRYQEAERAGDREAMTEEARVLAFLAGQYMAVIEQRWHRWEAAQAEWERLGGVKHGNADKSG